MTNRTNVWPRRGAVSRDGLLVAGLVILIGGSVALVVRTWMTGSEDPRDPAVIRARAPIDFECELCGYKFTLPRLEFHKQWKDVDRSKLPPSTQYKSNCPKCEKPFCCKMLGDGVRPPTRPAGPTGLP